MTPREYLNRILLKEYASGNNPSIGKGETVGDSNVVGVSNDLSIFSNVVVKNPKGKGFRAAGSGFGFGMGAQPNSIAMANDVINKFSPKDQKFSSEDEQSPETEESGIPTWQDVNRAIGNFVRNKVNQSLEPMQLGPVANNPVAKFDGFDMKKIGVVTDKKYLKSLGLKLGKYK